MSDYKKLNPSARIKHWEFRPDDFEGVCSDPTKISKKELCRRISIVCNIQLGQWFDELDQQPDPLTPTLLAIAYSALKKRHFSLLTLIESSDKDRALKKLQDTVELMEEHFSSISELCSSWKIDEKD